MTKLTLLGLGGLLLVQLYIALPATPTYAAIPTLTPREEINPGQAHSLPNGGREYTLDDPQLSDVPLLINYAIKFLLSLVGAVVLFFFMSGAFEYIWMIPIEKKQEGKNRMIYAILGFVIVLLAYIIVDTLVNVIF